MAQHNTQWTQPMAVSGNADDSGSEIEELVVLVDEQNNVIGTMSKQKVHGAVTPLHRAFSSYLFHNSNGKLLLQQRSSKKQTWPLVWSNSCCGHPGPGESPVQAAKRRINRELGLDPIQLEEVAPYRYCFTRDGIMENEICPILVGIVDREPVFDPEEVEAVRWVDWNAFIEEIDHSPGTYSEWCEEQVGILRQSPRFQEIIGNCIK